MSIRNPARLGALAAALALMGCGSQAGGATCDYNNPKNGTAWPQKGCVFFKNFYGRAEIGGLAVPATTSTAASTGQGLVSTMVANTSVNSTNPFQAVVNGQPLASVTCTVTSFGWLEFNPEVVLQQSGALTCLYW